MAARQVCILLLPLLAVSLRAQENPLPPPPMPPLPEGEAGISSKYPGDVDIEKDPAVVFADGFENGAKPWDGGGWGNSKTVTQAENVHSGKSALELIMVNPAPGKETTCGAHKHFKPESYDLLFVRYYVKFEKSVDMLHHNHNYMAICARAPGVPDAKPGIPADGKSDFSVCLEPARMSENPPPVPGEWNIYCYHPEQRSQWGDHFWPTGRISPQPTPRAPIVKLFGPNFVPRPNIVPERDRWICMELMVKANTPGQRDGRIAFWTDGKLAADFTNMRLRDVATLKATHICICMATRNSVNDAPVTMWYDDVVVATSYIGPMARRKSAAPPAAATGKNVAEKDAVAAPTAAPPAAAAKVDPKALAPWEAKLVSRVAQGVKDGQRPTAHLCVMGRKAEAVRITGADANSLFVEVQGNSLPMAWQRLLLSDRLSLARAFLKEEKCDDLLLAAVFALADSRADLAADYFARVAAADPKDGAARVAEARASLGLK